MTNTVKPLMVSLYGVPVFETQGKTLRMVCPTMATTDVN